MGKVIVRVKGGLGNQLFCYAAARRLSLANDAELVIDHVTGFVRDHQYERAYMLDHFNIPARKATPAERFEPFERYRRAVLKWLSRRKPFAERHYLEQEGHDFDERLLHVKVEGTLYLDGYWQSESYFKDVEQSIREELQIIPPTDTINRRMSEEIRSNASVAIHVRWFNTPASADIISTDYYRRAITHIEKKIESPHYFLFSDNPEATKNKLTLPENRMTAICHNQGDENAYADLWLMTQCNHFIIANSTFSWWGAWLARHKSKIVICPSTALTEATNWGFEGLVPERWLQV